jgi:LysM repeat protein
MIKLLFLIAFAWNVELPADSIGVETVNGKIFIVHRVEEKETLFAISRRYKTTVDAILQYNPTAGSGLEIGQILKVPYVPKVAGKPVQGTVHKVAPKETLYSISRIYQVSTDEIKRWNNLPDNSISIGQELVINKSTAQSAVEPVKQSAPGLVTKKGYHTVGEKETLFSIARQYGVSVDQLKAWNSLVSNELKAGQTLFVAQPERASKPEEVSETAQPVVKNTTPDVPASTPATKDTSTPVKQEVKEKTASQSAESIRISESLRNGDEIIEGGLAELIEGTEGNRKYLALHRTAPMGTILKVRNEMNNREVFVRVMGKLPDTALTNKLIIKISKSAYDRLGAIDSRFRVEVTYYK